LEGVNIPKTKGSVKRLVTDIPEEPIHIRNGMKRILHTIKIPIFDEQGNAEYLLGISEDITERKQSEELLRESEFFFSQMFEQSMTGTCLYNPEGTIIRVNPEFCKMFGVDEKMITDGRFNVFQDEATIKAGTIPILREIFDEKKTRNWEIDYDIDLASESTQTTTSIKGKMFLEIFGYPIVDNTKKLKYVVLQHYDITERKLGEKKIQSLLQEKEILLKEIHHRVKNNMNVIRNLLTMQSDIIDIPEASSAFQDAIARIESMRILYNKLYRTESYKDVSIKDYLELLIDEIFQLFPNMQNIKIEKQIENFVIGTKTIFPLGIIVNELITNAMKYAFLNRDSGLLKISAVKENNHVTFIFEDNGVGMPEIDETHKGFGLTLIGLLVEQIGGSYKIERNNGTKFIIEFDI
jgi:two-component sensor histidine kinase